MCWKKAFFHARVLGKIALNRGTKSRYKEKVEKKSIVQSVAFSFYEIKRVREKDRREKNAFDACRIIFLPSIFSTLKIYTHVICGFAFTYINQKG